MQLLLAMATVTAHAVPVKPRRGREAKGSKHQVHPRAFGEADAGSHCEAFGSAYITAHFAAFAAGRDDSAYAAVACTNGEADAESDPCSIGGT